MRTKQVSLFTHFDRKDLKKRYGRTVHGGVKSQGRRKQERPLAANKPVHLVLKSQKAIGSWSFLTPKNRQAVWDIIQRKAKKFGIRIADYANVGNHLHMNLRFSSRENFQNFLRAITCLIARKITGAKKGQAKGRFWEGLAFTRLLKTSFELKQLKGYFEANRVESTRGPAARQRFLDAFNRTVKKFHREELVPGSIKFGDLVLPPNRLVSIN